MADRTRYQKIREEDRRLKISITRHLQQLDEIQKELKDDNGALNVSALRLRADISLNLLKKRLPDLKAIEHSGSFGDKPLEEMSGNELAAELIKTRSSIVEHDKPAKRKGKSTRVH